MRKMYSEKQIKEMIAQSPDKVLEALQGQDLKVKTLEQSEANESLQLSVSGLNGLTLDENSFYKAKIINGILWIIAQLKVSNDTESAISATNISLEATIPEKYAVKIFKTDGYTIHEYVSGQETLIARDNGLVDLNVKPVSLSCYAKDKITAYIQTNNIGSGYYNEISIRVPIILL